MEENNFEALKLWSLLQNLAMALFRENQESQSRNQASEWEVLTITVSVRYFKLCRVG